MFLYNEKVRMVFVIVILTILVIGIVGGIVSGLALRGPSDETLKNFEEVSKKASGYTYLYRDELTKASEQVVAEENRWGIESTIVMVSVWLVTIIFTVFAYGFLLMLEMMDRILFVKGKEYDKLLEE